MNTNLKYIYGIIGANFGDEGKGMTAAYCAAQHKNEGDILVVLTNGGCQRGHTVIDGKNNYRHVFHHFGSATFVGGHTYCPQSFVVNPCSFITEYLELSKKGYDLDNKIYINKNCQLTTVYDMLINQVVEIDRGNIKHGSCGFGVFETLYRNHAKSLAFKDKLIEKIDMTVDEFNKLNYLNKLDFLNYLRTVYVPHRLDELHIKKDLDEVYNTVLKSHQVMANYIEDFEFMINHSILVDNLDSFVSNYTTLIFENGQGLLLDQNNMDYYPHLTPSNTGMKNINYELGNISSFATGAVFNAYYVTRTYATRHGAGRFDTECAKKDINPKMYDETNVFNPWQDTLRYGTLDSKLDERCEKDFSVLKTSLPNDWHLAITHLNEYMPKYKYNFKKVGLISYKEGEFVKSLFY